MKVLIIDDEPLVRRSLEKIFCRSGHEVFVAMDGNDGVKKWREIEPDAVVIDVLMPGLTGPEVISKIEKTDQKKSVAIALISAYSGDYNPESIKSLGADIFIEKPFENIRDIVTLVQSLWEKKNQCES